MIITVPDWLLGFGCAVFAIWFVLWAYGELEGRRRFDILLDSLAKKKKNEKQALEVLRSIVEVETGRMLDRIGVELGPYYRKQGEADASYREAILRKLDGLEAPKS